MAHKQARVSHPRCNPSVVAGMDDDLHTSVSGYRVKESRVPLALLFLALEFLPKPRRLRDPFLPSPNQQVSATNITTILPLLSLTHT